MNKNIKVFSFQNEKVKILSDEQLRKLTESKSGTFDKMIRIREEADKKKLMALEEHIR
jgi:hypothetical protein